jgi:hypothetical protein
MGFLIIAAVIIVALGIVLAIRRFTRPRGIKFQQRTQPDPCTSLEPSFAEDVVSNMGSIMAVDIAVDVIGDIIEGLID